MSNLIKPIALVIALSVPAIASAEVAMSEAATEKVHLTYNAEDAATRYGRVRLERQIRHAAEKVCGVHKLRRVGSLRQLMESRSCYDKAVAEAMKSISTAV